MKCQNIKMKWIILFWICFCVTEIEGGPLNQIDDTGNTFFFTFVCVWKFITSKVHCWSSKCMEYSTLLYFRLQRYKRKIMTWHACYIAIVITGFFHEKQGINHWWEIYVCKWELKALVVMLLLVQIKHWTVSIRWKTVCWSAGPKVDNFHQLSMLP